MMREVSDARLIAQSVAAPEYFVPVFERHFSVVHKFLRLRAASVADELAAETFVVAFKRRSAYSSEHADARPWLFGIALNLLRAHWRSERRKRAALLRLHGERETDSSDRAIERADAHRSIASLRALLEPLPPDDRDLLLLHACVGLSYDEAAHALGIPPGTARSRLHRLHARLRASLATQADDQRVRTGGQ